VLSEKPVAVSVAAADRMIEACDRAGVLLGLMFQMRTYPARVKFRELVQAGAVGDCTRFR